MQRTTLAGGFPMAAGALIGAAWGIRVHQPSAGLVIGFAVGSAIAALIWVVNRRR